MRTGPDLQFPSRAGGIYQRSGGVDIEVAMDRLSPDLFARHLVPVGSDHVRLSDALRAAVTIGEPAWLPGHLPSADVVMVRNVWVHLEPEQRIGLVARLADALPAEGLVVFRAMHATEVTAAFPATGHPQVFRRPDAVAWQRLNPSTMRPATDVLHTARPS